MEKTMHEDGAGKTDSSKPKIGLAVSAFFRKHRKLWADIALYVGSFVFIFLSYVVFKQLPTTGDFTEELAAKVYGVCLLLALLAVFLVFVAKGKASLDTVLLFIALAALIFHVTYMLVDPARQGQYDTWSDEGHFGYAKAFFETWALPVKNTTGNTVYQFYHPPLNAAIQGLFMHIFQAVCWVPSLTGSTDLLFSSCQILACFYMFVSSVVIIKTLRLMKFSKWTMVIVALFAALFPRLNQLSGQLNNDSLVTMFSFIALYFAFKWYLHGKKMVDIILLAASIGLAMMSKLSAVVICLGIAVVFVIELVRSIMKKPDTVQIWHLIFQYVIFLLICAPLGLWFQFYSHYVYGLPYGYVFSNLNAGLFTGTQSWVSANRGSSALTYYNAQNSGLIYTNDFYNVFMRFISPLYIPDFAVSGPIMASSWNDYNLLSYAIRSALFGEFESTGGTIAGTANVLAGYVLWFSTLAGLVYCAIKKVKLGKEGRFSLYLMAGIVAFFIYLSISMPYGCSMDFRYIVPLILPLAIVLGKLRDSLKVRRYADIVILTYVVSGCLFYLLASAPTV